MRLPRAHIGPLALVVGAFSILAACSSGDGTESEAANVVSDDTMVVDSGEVVVDDAAVRVTEQTDNSSEFGANGTVTVAPGAPAPPTLPAASGDGQQSLAAPSTVAPATTASTAPPSTAAPATTAAPVVEEAATSTTAVEAPADASAPIGDPDGAALAVGEDYSSSLLGGLRTGLTLPTLVRQAEMDQFARDWSRQMAESGILEHSNGPYGENIAYTTNTALTASEAADVFHQLWVDSPGHYRNMTNETYASSGIGLYRTENGWYGTHVFGF